MSGDRRPTEEVGTRARERLKLGPQTVDQEFEVLASVPGRRIAWRMVGGGAFRGEVALDSSRSRRTGPMSRGQVRSG
jgi:hypothetical protein